MKHAFLIRLLFALAAAYDGVLGLLFLAAPAFVFERCGVNPPNHLGYVQFPAALLLIFGLMFVKIARDPIRHRGLIIYGILLKVAYCGVSGWHWLSTDIPRMWKPFTLIDAVMGLLFVWTFATISAIAGKSGSALRG
jgi:hypothetical protein